MLEGVVKSRRERRYMIFGLVALTLFSLCTIGTVVGLTYAVVDALKDTEVVGGVMMVKGSTVDPVKISSADFTIVDGAAVTSQRANTANGNAAVNATSSAHPENVLRTATYMGTPMPFTSAVDVRTLMELRYLYIKGLGKVELALMVTGVARVPMANSVHGDVVRIITSVGAYEVLGFFNFIRNLEAFSPQDPDLPKSQLPDENFKLTLKIYEPCVLPSNPDVDRSLQGLEVVSGQDLAGVEIVDGKRYMTRNETVVTWNGATQVIYQYALVPEYEKVELNDVAQGITHTWQRVSSSSVAAGKVPAVVGTLFCSSNALVARPSAAVVPPTVEAMPEGSGFNYTYEGVDLMEDDTPARHFRLVVLANGTVTQTIVVDSFHYLGGSRVAGVADNEDLQEQVVLSPSERRRLEAESEARAVEWDRLDHVNGTGEWPQWALDVYGGVRPSTSSRRMLQANSCPKMDGGVTFPKGSEPCEGEASFNRNFNFLVDLDCSGEIAPSTGLTMHGLLNLDSCQGKYEGCITLNWEIPGSSSLVKGANAVTDLPSVEFVRGCISYDATTGIWTMSMVAEPKLQPDWLQKAFADTLNQFLGTWVIKGQSGNVWIDEVTVSWDIAFDPLGNILNAVNLAYDLGSQGVALITNAVVSIVDGKPVAQITTTLGSAASTLGSAASWVGGAVSSVFGFGRRRHLGSLIDKSMLPKTGIKITKEEFKIVKKGSPFYLIVAINYNTMLTVYDLGAVLAQDRFYGSWMPVKWCGYITNRGKDERYKFQGTQMTGYNVRMVPPQGSSRDDSALTAARFQCIDGSNTAEEANKDGVWQSTRSCDPGAYIVGARVRAEDWQGFERDNSVVNSIQFRCNKGTGSSTTSPLDVHSGFWGGYTNWVNCPANTFVCGVQLRVDTSGYQVFMTLLYGWLPTQKDNIDKKGVTAGSIDP
ncbi:hypothetical protein GPECTOR_35g903 [Gonium pectorale]|uniref:Uncharacterized protein n=1 Tax=Gonium pectorale TaxID=33097 RepID=A0A150GD08_GONPE|nr:hypothetical protein GPECTOR_35g903 [Gonium pectorale]|eukprot:KXZ47465.1 hypothetical protein GPECTOR_35g903 [Gonium pectorale]